ncbi:MAG: hypothetical protein E7585_01150 [Ruminococcaceae bacterium]|nr:hypothetical protein [Oscillospiraceae bacterium]
MIYQGDALREISFPLGGIGSGSVGLAGNGSLVDWEIYNKPNKGSVNGYTHIAIRAKVGNKICCRVLQGDHIKDLTGSYTGAQKEVYDGFGFGPAARTMAGFPHFRHLRFCGEFPIAELYFEDPDFPLPVTLTAFNPLIPLEADKSSLPAAFFEVSFQNTTKETVVLDTVFSLQNPFPLSQNTVSVNEGVTTVTLAHGNCDPGDAAYGELALSVENADMVQPYWYRGSWQDGIVTFWNELSGGGALRSRQYEAPYKGDHCSLGKSLVLQPGERGKVRFLMSWYCPNNRVHWNPHRTAWNQPGDEERLRTCWKNYYAVLFDSACSVGLYGLKNWKTLYTGTDLYRKTLFSSTLDPAVIDAAASTLSVLKSSAIYRLENGAFYGFEGVHEHVGSCEGTCQHVYNYAYALCFLFPTLERSIRDLEFCHSTWETGATEFRLALPLREPREPKRSCLDGQMGCVIKTYREWKLSGDDAWLRRVWPTVKKVLEYAWSEENKDAWDRDKDGVLEGRQHHTLDVELYGPSSWLEGFYLAALKAAAEMATYLGERDKAAEYLEIFEKGKRWTAENLFNGSYFVQKVDVTDHTLIERYGGERYWNSECGEIKYQIGEGCAIDQLLGQWHANLCGLGDLFDREQRRVALRNLFANNYKSSMRGFTNPWRNFCVNDEAGTVICSYPEGAKKPTIPITYCEETMHGFEYAFAGLLISEGLVEEGLMAVRAVRNRYQGYNRNPWNEIECGSNYARSMASFALLPIFSGFRFDLPRGRIGFAPVVAKEDFACLWSVGTAWGQVRITKAQTRITVLGGEMTLCALELPYLKTVSVLRVDGREIAYKHKDGIVYFEKMTVAKEIELF